MVLSFRHQPKRKRLFVRHPLIHDCHERDLPVNTTSGNTTSEVTKEKLISDFKVVVADAEALLKASAGQGGEALAAVRSRVEQSLKVAKDKMLDAEEELLLKTKAAAKATDEYVHDHPWHAVGIAAGIGLVVGMLIGRR